MSLISRKHAGPSGIFIATGAIESLGNKVLKWGTSLDCVFLLVLLFLCALTLVVQKG